MKTRITKRFGRSISYDKQLWSFMTELSFDDVEYETAEELIEKSNKIFDRTRSLTEADIASVHDQIVPKKLEKNNATSR